MRGRRETLRAPAVLAPLGVLLALVLPGAGGANPAPKPSALHERQAALGDRAHAALLSLYSLDSRLAEARRRVAALRQRLADVRAQQAQAQLAQQIARRVWRESVETLGAHLRAMYEQDPPDAVAILFGASSIDDAMTRLDALQRSAQLSRQTVEQTRAARKTLRVLAERLASHAAELQALVAQASDTAAALSRARAERVAYLASLRRERRWTSRRIAVLDAAAQRSAERSQVITAGQQPVAAPASPPTEPIASSPVAAGQTLTVVATGYSLGGTTATGLPVGPGVVAVDPSVIPLGTRMTIPGYGEGIAADTGGAVRGATIDLWFASEAQARAWGRRTLVITLH